MKRVAILGATGYIGKSLAYQFVIESEPVKLFLFSRSQEKLIALKEQLKPNLVSELNFHVMEEFASFEYDVVINCTGVSDMSSLKSSPENIVKITQDVDDIIIAYLKDNKDTVYINMSSGAVYNVFEDGKQELSVSDYYTLAKINSEKNHRLLTDLAIVDIRIFSFFSSFVDTQAHFFMSEVVACLQDKKMFVTNDEDMVRDYLTPPDLLSLIKNIIDSPKKNDYFDAYTLEPVSKFTLLDFLHEQYGLSVSINELPENKKGLSKNRYIPDNKKAEMIGYHPEHTSLQGIQKEIYKMQL